MEWAILKEEGLVSLGFLTKDLRDFPKEKRQAGRVWGLAWPGAGGVISPYSVGQASRDPQVGTGSLALVLSGRMHGERAGAWGDLSGEPLIPRPTTESPGGPGKQTQVQGSLSGPILFRHGRLQCQADVVSRRTQLES